MGQHTKSCSRRSGLTFPLGTARREREDRVIALTRKSFHVCLSLSLGTKFPSVQVVKDGRTDFSDSLSLCVLCVYTAIRLLRNQAPTHRWTRTAASASPGGRYPIELFFFFFGRRLRGVLFPFCCCDAVPPFPGGVRALLPLARPIYHRCWWLPSSLISWPSGDCVFLISSFSRYQS